jgi:hypothetical protein
MIFIAHPENARHAILAGFCERNFLCAAFADYLKVFKLVAINDFIESAVLPYASEFFQCSLVVKGWS